ncbi:hypothetical protein [Streptomyces sp. AA1529]|uniref:hypothetical protein n=1 Tax=Streptomyces sp. AA1529 TaxID=1203257 RepID=UPI0002E6179E|nr:hypothetical protein [Streptomyces sp. AA1529]
MRDVEALDSLWAEYCLPLRDALYVRQGEQVRAHDVSYDSDRPGGLVIGESFDLAAELAEDPEWVSWVDGQREVELPGGGQLWAGEGDQGSQGFFARLAEDGTLVWAVFLTESNPFTEIRPVGREATFTSTAGVVITVDIDDPAGR